MDQLLNNDEVLQHENELDGAERATEHGYNLAGCEAHELLFLEVGHCSHVESDLAEVGIGTQDGKEGLPHKHVNADVESELVLEAKDKKLRDLQEGDTSDSKDGEYLFVLVDLSRYVEFRQLFNSEQYQHPLLYDCVDYDLINNHRHVFDEGVHASLGVNEVRHV